MAWRSSVLHNPWIFKKDGLEIISPPQSMAFFASSSQVKREGGEVVSPDLGPTATETNREGKFKRKVNSGKKKIKESESSPLIKEAFSARRDCAGASSSSSAEFTVFIKGSHLKILKISVSASRNLLPKERTTFKIHHPDMKKSWNVVYIPRHEQGLSGYFSSGWRILVQEYPVLVGEACKFTFLKPTELLLIVSKRAKETH
ncbi:B3 domain-containing protein At2g35310 [Eutrema salsugineum]|uniref:B3 domain-containing protein At2g35310 n=1 Tax=Eutrema salsugineum TaxID=72664 RepID=UPI000CED27C2|nr:B3 domain-containing protein At2g35310 [Eutrema salsugineum]